MTDEEILLADLMGAENAQTLFETILDRNTSVEQTLEQLNPDGVGTTDVPSDILNNANERSPIIAEEAVDEQPSIPDNNETEELLQSMGMTLLDGQSVRTVERMEWRDRSRWELNPESSEDYPERFE